MEGPHWNCGVDAEPHNCFTRCAFPLPLPTPHTSRGPDTATSLTEGEGVQAGLGHLLLLCPQPWHGLQGLATLLCPSCSVLG